MGMFEVLFQNHKVNKILMIVGSSFAFLFGGWNEFLQALIILQGLDIILGLINAGRRREVSSRALLIGVERKLGIWIALILANVIDSVVFNNQPIAMTGLTFSFIGYEGLSIVENLALIGVPLPDWITRLLIQVRIMHDDRIAHAIDNLDPNTVEKVIIKTEYGKEKVLHDDKKTAEFFEKQLEDKDK